MRTLQTAVIVTDLEQMKRILIVTNEEKPPLVIYHANCADGFGAAWAAYLAMPTAEFLSWSYGEDPPDVKGRNVYIVDFSFKRKVLEEMHEKANTLRVIDHHKTAEADLEGLDYCTFDMSKSGAVLTWEYFHFGPNKVPRLLEYVQDRDLWKWALPSSKEINAYIATVPKTFENWQELCEQLEFDLVVTAEKGRVALRIVEKYVESQLGTATRVVIRGHKVPMINTTFAQSELIGALAKNQPFAIGWRHENGKFIYSLRSRKGGIDVSEIAKRYGGGGHAGAAGFEADVPGYVLDEGTI